MTENLELQLQANYPKMFKNMYGKPQETCMAWGIENDDGWCKLINNLCFEIQNYCSLMSIEPPIIDQIKSKWGTLRFYYHFENYIEEHDNFVEKLVNKVEHESSVTCEFCGYGGRLSSNMGWLWTVCFDCYKKYEMKMFTDDME